MKKIFISSLILPILFAPTFAFAANVVNTVEGNYKLLEPLPCINGTAPNTQMPNCKNGVVTEIDMTKYLGYLFRLMIAIAAFSAVLIITYSGFEYMMSEAWGTKSSAKARIKNAIFGLLFAVGSYLFLYTIDPRLVNVNLVIPKLGLTASSTAIFDPNDRNSLVTKLGETATQVRNEIQDANAKSAKLRADATAIRNSIDQQNLSDDEAIKMETDAYNKIDEANSIDADSAVKFASTVFNSTALRAANVPDVASARSIASKIETDYTDTMAILDSTGHPEFKTGITDLKNYNKNMVDDHVAYIQLVRSDADTAAQFKKEQDAAIKTIQTQTQKQMATTANADLKQKYQSDLDNTIKQIKAIQYKTPVNNAAF